MLFPVIDGIADSSLASIANTSNEVILTVMASDDPYGKFAFTPQTKSLTIAEDFYPGQEASTKATFVVERRQGIFGIVEVKKKTQCFKCLKNAKLHVSWISLPLKLFLWIIFNCLFFIDEYSFHFKGVLLK